MPDATTTISLEDRISLLMGEGFAVGVPTLGSSMYPTISTGDRVVISAADDRELAVGQIIGVKLTGHLFCHRLVRIFEQDGRTWYQTRGDAHWHCDPPVTVEQIVGLVSKVERPPGVGLVRGGLLFLNPGLNKFRLLPLFVPLLESLARLQSRISGRR